MSQHLTRPLVAIVLPKCPMWRCDGQLAEDESGQFCQKCDYAAPPGSHELGHRSVRAGQSEEHQALKVAARTWLRKRGFEVVTEYGCKVSRPIVIRRDKPPQRYLIIDVVGLKRDRPIVAIECGYCKPRKLEALQRGFKEVWKWRHGWAEPKPVAKSNRFRGLKYQYGVDVPRPAFLSW